MMNMETVNVLSAVAQPEIKIWDGCDVLNFGVTTKALRDEELKEGVWSRAVVENECDSFYSCQKADSSNNFADFQMQFYIAKSIK